MKVKLKSSQFFALLGVFESFCGEDITPPSHMEARLMLAIMTGIYKQLQRKAIDKKPKYTVTFNDVEALAFWVFFSKYDILKEGALYESTLIHIISNQIHKQYS